MSSFVSKIHGRHNAHLASYTTYTTTSSAQKDYDVGDVGEYPINPLMCLSIAAILPHPILHAYLRSAGQTGLRVFEELITLRMIPCCLESPQTTEPPSLSTHSEEPPREPWEEETEKSPPVSTTQLIPIFQDAILMPQSPTMRKQLNGSSTLVVFPEAVLRLQILVFKSGFPSLKEPFKCVRYRQDATADTPPEFSGDIFTPPAFVVHIPDARLVVVEGFNSVTSIGQQFREFQMPNIDFSSLAHAERLFTISNNFLYQCKNITQIDLSPFGNVTTIGDQFMEECESLQSIDLSPFCKVTTIGDDFLARTSSLRTVNFGDVESLGIAGGMGSCLTNVGNSFLINAVSLEQIDLKTFTNIKTVGDFFLSYCTSLRYVDLRPFGNDIDSVGICILYGCGDITVDHSSRLLEIATGTRQLKTSQDGRFTM